MLLLFGLRNLGSRCRRDRAGNVQFPCLLLNGGLSASLFPLYDGDGGRLLGRFLRSGGRFLGVGGLFLGDGSQFLLLPGDGTWVLGDIGWRENKC